MAKIEITPTSLVVHIDGFDRFLALICGVAGGFGGRVEVPLEHVAGVDASVPEAHRFWKGWTVTALSLQNVVALGRIFYRGEWAFWDVHDPDQAIAIHLQDEPYAKLVIGVDDPPGVTAEIARAVPPAGRRDPRQGRGAPGRLSFTMVIVAALLAVAIVELVLVALGIAPVIEVVVGLIVAWLVPTLSSGWLIPGLMRR
jgi:hypothetical protein